MPGKKREGMLPMIDDELNERSEVHASSIVACSNSFKSPPSSNRGAFVWMVRVFFKSRKQAMSYFPIRIAKIIKFLLLNCYGVEV
jgi:hypothetical protein